MKPSLSGRSRLPPRGRGLAALALGLLAALVTRPVPRADAAESRPASIQRVRVLGFGVAPVAPPAGAHLDYYGGPVISNVQVVMVRWGSGTYQPFVAGTVSPGSPWMATFYGGVTDSGYLDWLAEYDTNVTPVGGGTGTNQTVGRGTFLGPPIDIVPLPANDGTIIDDTNVQAELDRQLGPGGALPAPATDGAGNPNTLYMLHFPKGKTITLGGMKSCASGGFCAYHSTGNFLIGGHRAYYGVLPDMSAGSGCDIGCGGSAPFDNQTAVAAHELAEAVTDPAVGLAMALAPPLSWYDQVNGEIADICNGLQGTVTGGDGVVYTVAQLFSNAAGRCLVTRNDFSIGLTPTFRTLARGSSITFTVSTAVTAGSPETIALSISALPAGLGASFSPPSVTTGGSSTLTVSASVGAALGTTAFIVTGNSPSATHAVAGNLTVDAVLAVIPSSATLAPRAAQTFGATGGSGTGHVWSLPTNASGGTIDAATGAYQAGPAGSVTDAVRVTDSLGNTAGASVAVTAGISISPPAATVQAGKPQAFAATGGSGAGYAWSLPTNASGGTIDAVTGAYQAGPSGGVTDVVEVTDSLGNIASASAIVTSPTKRGCGCGAGGGDPVTLLALALAFLRRGARLRLARPRRPA